jgi:hypothetical protein
VDFEDFEASAASPAKAGLARLWPPPRRDAAALGFGLAFLIFGAAGLARAAGAPIHAGWFSPLILICLGVAGLLASLRQRRRI